MDHGTHGGAGSNGSAATTHGSHETHGARADAMSPVVSPVPVRMTAALNSHAVVSAILADRARAISRDAAAEALILVAHGPVPDDDNRRWLQDLGVVAARVREAKTFASIDYLTVRDDAPAPVRDQATAELRALVQRRSEDGRRVLIVPVVLSFGGIEEGIKKRLEGLRYDMAPQGLIPDERLAAWVLEMAGRM
jgi:hypothetical protein